MNVSILAYWLRKLRMFTEMEFIRREHEIKQRRYRTRPLIAVDYSGIFKTEIERFVSHKFLLHAPTIYARVAVL